MKSKLLPILLIVAVVGWLASVSAQAATPIRFAGGDGSSVEKAVVIKGGNEETGVHAEYNYLAKHFPGYKRGGQSVFTKGKRSYDQLDFTTAKGEKKTIFFNITAFYGKLD